jgi:protein-tyrosine phosphatase
MIDLRCHVLDGTACGPQNFAESLEMCRLAAEEGVRTLVATPLWSAKSAEPPLPLDDCQQKLEQLQQAMRGALMLRLGFVMRLGPQLPALVERYGNRLALGGGCYVLASLPALRVPEETEAVCKALAARGFGVVLSGPECNSELRRDPLRLSRWVADGVLLQLNAASITGAYGRDVRRFAEQCVREFASRVVVASSARNEYDRRASLRRAGEEIGKRFGHARARSLVSKTPSEIIGTTETARPNRRRLGWTTKWVSWPSSDSASST